MGLDFGNLRTIRRIAEFSISHHEQKLLPNIPAKIANTARRFYDQLFKIGVPFVIAYSIYEWGETTYKKNNRKNPADYANDV